MKPVAPRCRPLFPVLLAMGLTPALAHAQAAAAPRSRWTSTVGMPGEIAQLVLPGSELEVKPLQDRRAAFVLRIKEAFPHGSAFRYDLVYYGLEPGEYDLRSFLKRKDGSALGELPPVPVTVEPVLPPGQIEPHPLALGQSPWLGGYRLLLATAGSLWCAGLAAILLVGRRRHAKSEAASARTLTLADHLKPLVDAALLGRLSKGQHAELERLLIGYWRKRLGLEQESPAQAIKLMRDHPEAGALLRKLEAWLHQPSARVESADLANLLRPYQNLEDLEHQETVAPAVEAGTSTQEIGS